MRDPRVGRGLTFRGSSVLQRYLVHPLMMLVSWSSASSPRLRRSGSSGVTALLVLFATACTGDASTGPPPPPVGPPPPPVGPPPPPPPPPPPTTSEKVDEVIEAQTSALDSANQVLAATSDIASALSAAEEFLRAHPAVAAVTRPGNTSINLTYTSGLRGGIIFAYADENGTITTRGAPLVSRTDAVDSSRQPPSNGRPVMVAGERTPTSARYFDLILSNKVLLFEPFADDFAPYVEGDSIKSLVAKSGLGLVVDQYKNGAATVDVLSRMTDYGLVVLATHGSEGEWIMTRTEVPQQDFERYEIQIGSGMFGIYMHAVVNSDGMELGVPVFSVNSKFVKTLDGTFPQSVIINNSCESTMTTGLLSAFLERGARTYYGYNRVVGSAFATTQAIQVVGALAQSMTTGEAFRPGQTDPQTPGAVFQMFGDPAMRFPSGAITGTVTVESMPVEGVAVSLAGPQATGAVTGSLGTYEFTRLPGGDYTVWISDIPDGSAFRSTSESVNISPGDSVIVDFDGSWIRASAVRVSVERIVGGTRVPVPGVTVNLTGPDSPHPARVTYSDGQVAFIGLRAGTYTVSIPGASKTVTVGIEDAPIVNFLVSGSVTSMQAPQIRHRAQRRRGAAFQAVGAAIEMDQPAHLGDDAASQAVVGQIENAPR